MYTDLYISVRVFAYSKVYTALFAFDRYENYSIHSWKTYFYQPNTMSETFSALQRRINEEDALAVARAVLETGGSSARNELLAFLAAVDLDFAFGRPKGAQGIHLVKGGTADLLTRLGIELPEQEIPHIIGLGQQSAFSRPNVNTPPPETLSLKELELLFARHFKDTEARKRILELFWGKEPFYTRGNLRFLETAQEVNSVLSPVDSRERGSKSNVVCIGKTHAEVEQTKQDRGTETSMRNVSSFVSYTAYPGSGEPENRTDTDDADQIPEDVLAFMKEKASEFFSWRKTQMEQFSQATFCFCVYRLFQNIDTIVWLENGKKGAMPIPPEVQQKLDLIQSMAQGYDFFDLTPHLESAFACFVEYYFPHLGQIK